MNFSMPPKNRIKYPPERLLKLEGKNTNSHVRSPYDHVFHISGNSLVVRQSDKQRCWRLFSSVVGRIEKAYPYYVPKPLGWPIREITIMPDQTTLVAMDKILRGKRPVDVKNPALHRKIVNAYLDLAEHRAKVYAKLKSEKKIFWHET
jgi:hypothetical protein